ncbi:MAG: Haloacid dehalogenase, type [Pseudomonas sp.]|jgi:2-haloacid dehalogenase|uniref:haloacid dehalogenase type II n=1 Tax=Pseudomonas sp. TaxID=306 RepID=UPI00261721C8|nr:haloacid dehalogenase type II [Pseudomonas sp.]MDB6050937.1 Haloacid dehalogenase, type [Pseudomonas sp.]
MTASIPRPTWITFDCYGTLIQWDEGLLSYVQRLLDSKEGEGLDPDRFINLYDRHEHRLEQTPPHRSFADISRLSMELTLNELGMDYQSQDADGLIQRIGWMPPFPEVPATLKWLKDQGFNLCIVSNTDDDIISGNVAQLGGYIDRVITAQQAQAYKPDHRLFNHAHRQLGVDIDQVLHICASPHLDLAAAKVMGFRCVWIDRGTRRKALPDYTPDAVLSDLAQVPEYIRSMGWTDDQGESHGA